MNYQSCSLCPRMCRVDRTKKGPSGSLGFCGCTSSIQAARAALHMWEEPSISGINGSGAVFFSGCTLRCCYCQNYQISTEHYGKELTAEQLSLIFLRLQDEGAHNINLVTATQYVPSVQKALDLVKHKLSIPVVYNSGGYERVETIQALKGYVDIYLPDFKYMDPSLSQAYSKAPDYPDAAKKSIAAMVEQTGPPVFEKYSDEKGSCLLIKKGVIVRHMVLPGHKEDSKKILTWLKEALPPKSFYLSLLSQYTPYYSNRDFPGLNRRITSYEYNQVLEHAVGLGLTDGYMQKKSSAKEEYTPPFNLEGLD